MIEHMERYCITVAKQMLDLEELPQALKDKLIQAECMIQKIKPDKSLTSTQIIASIILMCEEYRDNPPAYSDFTYSSYCRKRT